MRGLRLFVRPIETTDADSIRVFLAAHPGGPAPPASGLLGKLLGDLVAVVGFAVTSDGIRVDDVLVAKELRKKRIGRVMMDELERFAGTAGVSRIVVEDARDAAGFFRQIGFEKDGERWVKVVR